MLNTGDTVTGSYNFDSGTLFVDSTSNEVFIGDTSHVGNYGKLIIKRAGSQEAPVVGEHGVMVYNDGRASYGARDTTNNIEFAIGTSSLGTTFLGSMTNHDLDLRTGNTGKLRIYNSDGHVTITNNLGIGDTAPGEKLDVAGNINLTGVLKIDDVQILKEQQAHIEDADGTLADATTKINAILAMLETHGLVASS
jgi:hypothetical protein